MNRKFTIIAIASALILFLAALQITEIPLGKEKIAETPTPEEALEVLSQKLAQLDSQTREASNLRNTLTKVRHKGGLAARKSQPGTENPGALIEAFATIKTRADGTTYPANYKMKEFSKALKNKNHRPPLPWVERGPGNVSGRARAIVVDPGDPSRNTWFVTSIGGGIWKTSDGGSTYQNKTPELTALTTTTLAMCAGTPDVMYAGTGMGYGRVVEQAGSGIWKTTDRGETWFQLQSTANGQLFEAINRIVVDPANPNLVLACSNDSFSHLGPKGGVRKSGIFRSTDGGTSWTQVFDPDAVFGTVTDNRVQQIIATPGNFNVLYAAVNEVGVIKSTNRGLTWTVSANNFALPSDIGVPTANGFGLAGISVRTELAVSPSDTNRVYAAVERPRGTADLYMSTNAGANWSLINDTGNDPNWFNAFGAPGPNNYVAGWFDNTIAVHPYNPNIVFVGGVNLYRLTVNPSQNTRTSSLIGYWLSGFGVPQVHADHHWLEIIPVNQASNSFRILNANDGGVAVSNDGGNSWTRTQGMITTQFYGADKKPGEDAYIGGTQDNGTWLSPSQASLSSIWSRVVGGDGFESVWNYRDPNLLLGGSQNGNLSRSEDGGFTWTPIPKARAGTSPFISKIANSKTDPDLVFTVGSAGVNRSDDFGKTWNLTPINGNWLGYRPFDNVEISDADPRFVWISSRLGIDPPAGLRGGIHVSEDSGLSFTEISQNFPAGLDEASGIATHPQDPQTAYVLFSLPGLPKVLRTDNLGQSWQDLSGFAGDGQPSSNGFPDVAVFSLLVMPYDTDIIWVGTEIGLVISEDGGQTWSFADNGMPHVAIFQMRVVDDQVVVATMGRGVWSVTLPELNGYQPPQVTLVPRLNAVSQNPEGNAVISLDLRSPYDRTEIWINGEQVDTLVANDNAENTTVFWPVIEDTTINVSIRSFKDGVEYQPPTQSLSVTAKRAQTAYVANFDDGGNPGDFAGNGFSITTPTGFFNGAIHSPHPYTNSTDFIYELRVPLLVPEGNATLSYDNVVLVEPGAGSGVFGDPNFFDFVIVEGTRDGSQWIPLAPGYDSRSNSAWLAAYNAGSSGAPNLFIHQDIDVSSTFQPGELIFIRFRLNADPGVAGWGWAIDNLEIFADQLAQDPGEPNKDLIYPWISQNENFESIFVINNFGGEDTTVTLTARRELGIGERLAPLTIPANGFIREKASDLFPNINPGPGYTVLMGSTSPLVSGGWVTNNLTAVTGASPSQGVAVDRSSFTQIDNNRAGQRMLFGYLPITDGFISAPVVVNTGSQTTDVTLSFYDEQGTLLFQDSDSLTGLAPSRPFARVANTLLPDATGDVVMIAESSTQSISGVGFVFNQQGETAIGNATSLDPSENDPPDTNLLYAWVSNNEEFESIVIANNTTISPAQLTLTARRANGDTETVQRTVQGNGFLKEEASSLFPGLGDGSGYTVQLTSTTAGIKGRWVTNNLSAASGRSPSQGVAVSIPVPGAKASQRVGTDVVYSYLPLTGGTISAPVVVNVSEAPVNVVLDFYNAAGELVLRDDTTLLNLEPMRPFATVANTLITGVEEDVYMIARSSAGLITGVTFVFNEGLEPAIGNVTNTALP